MALTLMACYGGPPCEEGPDSDGDGYPSTTDCGPADCNDQDPNTYPDAPDPFGDGVDQNCDGEDGIAGQTSSSSSSSSGGGSGGSGSGGSGGN
jgi:hypothetical protein